MARLIAFHGIKNQQSMNIIDGSDSSEISWEQLNENLQKGNLIKEPSPCYYAYKHQFSSENGFDVIEGIIGLVPVSFSDSDKIRIHENTIDSRVEGIKKRFLETNVQKDIALSF